MLKCRPSEPNKHLIVIQCSYWTPQSWLVFSYLAHKLWYQHSGQRLISKKKWNNLTRINICIGRFLVWQTVWQVAWRLVCVSLEITKYNCQVEFRQHLLLENYFGRCLLAVQTMIDFLNLNLIIYTVFLHLNWYIGCLQQIFTNISLSILDMRSS